MAIAFTDQPTSGPFHRTTLWRRTGHASCSRPGSRATKSGGGVCGRSTSCGVKRPEEARRTRAANSLSILWGWPNSWRRDEISGGHQPAGPFQCGPCRQSCQARIDLPQAIQTVAAAYALPELAGGLSAGGWWSLVETLHRLAVDVQHLRVDTTQAQENSAAATVASRRIAAQRRSVTYSPSYTHCVRCGQTARQALSEGIHRHYRWRGAAPRTITSRSLGRCGPAGRGAKPIGQSLHHSTW